MAQTFFLILPIVLQATSTFMSVHSSSDVPSVSIEAAAEDITDTYFPEALHYCVNILLDPEDYIMYPNGTAYVEPYNQTYNETTYALREGGILIICAPSEIVAEDNSNLSSQPLNIISMIGVGISVVSLFIHLLVFALVKDLQNLPGCNLASLCLSLCLSYICLAVSKLDSLQREICIASAVCVQFFFLSSFMWMLVIAFDVIRSILNATGNFRVSSTQFKVKRYLYNSCVVWGTALVFVVAALIAQYVESMPENLRPWFEDTCWFATKHSLVVFFAGPVFAIIALNFIFFGVSAYSIHANRMKKTSASSEDLKKSHSMYFRLAVIMGATWVVGIIAPLLHDTSFSWMWYPFVVLNTLQGLFILVAFTFTGKVRKFFRAKFGGQRRASEQTLSPTFQSYCYYASSVDKDLDKVANNEVDVKDKSVQIDTVVIHL